MPTFWLTTLDGSLAGTSVSMKRKCCSPVYIVSIANKDFGSCCMIHWCLGSSEIECEISWYISFHLSHEENFSKLGFSPPLLVSWIGLRSFKAHVLVEFVNLSWTSQTHNIQYHRSLNYTGPTTWTSLLYSCEAHS
jgi:hypothetical protein